MIDQNGKLSHDNEHGYIWTTKCRKCRTEQKIRLGNTSLQEATQAVETINRIPRECPGGYHVEVGGWSYYWSLDLMLQKYAAKLAKTENLILKT